MTKVIFDISMSLDGYINAENPRLEAGLGDDGERLHDWAFNSKDTHNQENDGARCEHRCDDLWLDHI